MNCKTCGAVLTPNKRFCSQCGTPVEIPLSANATETIAQTLEKPTDTTTPATPSTPVAPVAETTTATPATPVTPVAETTATATPATPVTPAAETTAAATPVTPATPIAPTGTTTNPDPITYQASQQPQMSWQDWQNYQNWLNAQNTQTQTAQNKKANSVNLSGGIQKMEQSDSFIFRSLGITLRTLAAKPILLWGLSLMSVLLKILAKALCPIVPLFDMSVSSTLSAGMDCVYLDAYQGKEVNSKQIFSGFSSGKSFFHIAGGMLWRTLWLLIWGLLFLIPVIGPVMLIIKGISYSFTPYLLLKKPELSSLDALKRSMELTKGYKGKIFLTYLICFAALLVIGIIVALLAWAGLSSSGFFLFLAAIIALVVGIFCPLFFGILRAAMFSEVVRLEKVEDITL